MNEWDSLLVRRLAFAPFLIQEWMLWLWVMLSPRVRRMFLHRSRWRFAVPGVLLVSLFVMVSGYMWLNHSIAGPDRRDDDAVLGSLFLVHRFSLIVVVLVLAKRQKALPVPPRPKPTPRLVLLLLVVWVVVGAIVTAISIGPFAVLPLSKRDGLTIAACAGLGTLTLALALLLAMREKRRDATAPPR